MDYEGIEANCRQICTDVVAKNPDLRGAELFDTITAALAAAGVVIDQAATARLRLEQPNGVAVFDYGDGELDQIDYLQPGEFYIASYDPEDSRALMSEAAAIADHSYEEVVLTADDLAVLRYIVLDGVKHFGRGDVYDLHDSLVKARDARFDEQRRITFDLPNEFLVLCDQYGLTPVQALRGFVADVCGINNYLSDPRPDGYSSNGSDERWQARAYFDRAHWSPEVEENHGIHLSTW
jgi:hypothetical protein